MQLVKDITQSVLSFSSDAVIILTLIGLGAAYAFIMGKRPAISLILSYYPAAFIFRYLPFFKQYTASNPANAGQALVQAGIFLLILIPIHFILNQVISAESSFSRIRKIIESLILGGISASLAILTSYQVVNLKSLYNFAGGVDALFSSTYLFYWLILPFVVLFFMKE